MSIAVGAGAEFDTGLLGGDCWLELTTGERITLPVGRWHHDRPGDGDELLLGRCSGPTLDVGCGPGRLTAALIGRGIAALGVDSSRLAVELTRARGAVALHRNVFGRLPGEGRWHHVLLADGNVGIGGDPVALLRRVAGLVSGEGSALVELDPPGQGVRAAQVRVSGTDTSGEWFPWAWLGADAIEHVAHDAGLHLAWTAAHRDRWFAELVPRAMS